MCRGAMIRSTILSVKYHGQCGSLADLQAYPNLQYSSKRMQEAGCDLICHTMGGQDTCFGSDGRWRRSSVRLLQPNVLSKGTLELDEADSARCFWAREVRTCQRQYWWECSRLSQACGCHKSGLPLKLMASNTVLQIRFSQACWTPIQAPGHDVSRLKSAVKC
jgi:hypothetical protein